MARTQEIKQPIQTMLTKVQAFDLLDRSFKSAIRNIFKDHI